VVGLATLVAACDPVGPRGAAPAPAVLVANAGDGTVSRIDAAAGRELGPPVPVGAAPWQVVGGPPGALLVLSTAAASAQGTVRHAALEGGAWVTRPVPLGPGAGARVLAGDGIATGVVAYRLASDAGAAAGAACRLAAVDLRHGDVLRQQTVCDPAAESVVAAAAEWTTGGATAYLAIGRHTPLRGAAAGGHVLAVDLRTGATQARLPLTGSPVHVRVGPAPQGAQGSHPGGRWLYCVEATPPPGAAGPWDDDPAAWRWQLLGLRVPDLEPAAAWALPREPLWLAVAPDGVQAYALAGPHGAGPDTALLAVDLRGGAVRTLRRLPGAAAGVVVTERRLYVANSEGSEVWVLDRDTGRPLNPIRVGRHPVWLAPAAA
jgi:hypothetical protein